MFAMIGLAAVFLCVFGAYAVGGGKIAVILDALPGEVVTIGGAAVCAFLTANSTDVIRHSTAAVKRVFKGARYSKREYMDLLALLYRILRSIKTKGVLSIEQHIEKPFESSLFNAHPLVLRDVATVEFITDYMRMFSTGVDSPLELDALMEREIEKARHEDLHPAHAFSIMADGMPALGIVAAVLGVIKTMGSITEPPEVLGGLIGHALVGTFMGIFLAYCIVAPVATRLRGIAEEENRFRHVVRAAITAHLAGYAPQVSIEAARKEIPTEHMPKFYELEEALAAVA
ncbi:flagellar motor stator protein MotA [Nitrospirillum sp. BR 11164]|uniref:flagellar motor stator protein MotA n=1 Tax=Nitrospirillum sp. BR 11164 TaxID=3104324 RepID=UPI002AFEEF7F|nr:flagellar motor stator protein MotA [Nitrospirillum sp. BR 11164]MEA1650563.1 flagellar motor stator protein MotA [Nitrospirillum sp. BR 11164]